MISLKIGAEEFAAFAHRILAIPNGLDVVAEDVANTLRNIVVGKTPVASSALKRSWSPVQRTTGGFSFSTDLPYAVVIEEGLYKSVGPRTVEYEGGVYSRQAPGGMIGPVIRDDGMIAAIADKVIRELSKGVATS